MAAATTAMVVLPALQAQAQPTFVVNTTADPTSGSCAGGAGSLRQCLAVAATVPGSLVTFSTNGVFTLTQGELAVTGQVAIQGNGPANTIIDGNQGGRVMSIDTNGIIDVSGVTVRNGRTGSQGGGMLNLGALTVTDSAITGNSVVGVPTTDINGESVYVEAGGIFSAGSLTLAGTTVSGNSAIAQDSTPGAVANALGAGLFAIGSLSLTNSTISDNRFVVSAPGSTKAAGGGIFTGSITGSATATNVTITANSGATQSSGVDSFSIVFSNSIIAGNTGASECRYGPRGGGGYNLDDDRSCFGDQTDLHGNPLLGPLADNGGPTMTHALLAGSPAIDAVGTGCPPPAGDQRGVARPQGPKCDIGAYEADAGVPRPTTTTPSSTTTITTTTTTVAPTTTTTSTSTTTSSTTSTTAVPTITCVVTALLAGPPRQQQVTVHSSAGLASIDSIQIVNGTVSVAPFTSGTTDPVVVTATKSDPTKRTMWQFVAHDRLGNSQFCG